MLKARLDGDLSNLVQWKGSLSMAGLGVNQVILNVPSDTNHSVFCNSMILSSGAVLGLFHVHLQDKHTPQIAPGDKYSPATVACRMASSDK